MYTKNVRRLKVTVSSAQMWYCYESSTHVDQVITVLYAATYI